MCQKRFFVKDDSDRSFRSKRVFEEVEFRVGLFGLLCIFSDSALRNRASVVINTGGWDSDQNFRIAVTDSAV